MTELTDLDLLVRQEITGIKLFGYDTYKHENRERAARLRAELDSINAESDRRGLTTRNGLTDKGQSLNHEADPRVVAESEANRRFLERMYSGMR